jgi:hypothetical protein
MLPAARLPGPCYLCGRPLEQPLSDDHVPPLQFYAPGIRRQHNLNLLTIPVHDACNKAFQRDEDYFVSSLAPLAYDSYAGKFATQRVFQRYRQRENVGLVLRVFQEFDPRPSGLFLAGGKVLKRFDGKRVRRVSWKIIRGLYYHHTSTVLPESTPNTIKFVSPGESPPPEFEFIPDEPIRGRYPGVFDYKFTSFPDVENLHLWAMLLWDRIILVVAFTTDSADATAATTFGVRTTRPGEAAR